jgi:hypothetical protein
MDVENGVEVGVAEWACRMGVDVAKWWARMQAKPCKVDGEINLKLDLNQCGELNSCEHHSFTMGMRASCVHASCVLASGLQDSQHHCQKFSRDLRSQIHFISEKQTYDNNVVSFGFRSQRGMEGLQWRRP